MSDCSPVLPFPFLLGMVFIPCRASNRLNSSSRRLRQRSGALSVPSGHNERPVLAVKSMIVCNVGHYEPCSQSETRQEIVASKQYLSWPYNPRVKVQTFTYSLSEFTARVPPSYSKPYNRRKFRTITSQKPFKQYVKAEQFSSALPDYAEPRGHLNKATIGGCKEMNRLET